MTDAINAKSEVLDVRELDAVTGGFIRLPLVAVKVLEIRIPGAGTGGGEPGPTGGQNDPAQMFQQILQQLTQGGKAHTLGALSERADHVGARQSSWRSSF